MANRATRFRRCPGCPAVLDQSFRHLVTISDDLAYMAARTQRRDLARLAATALHLAEAIAAQREAEACEVAS